jgi:hypothetical protein
LPRNLIELRSFLGLANYFRRFVKDYSRVAAPLTDFTSEKVVFDYGNWPAKQLAAFNALKQALISTPVLCLSNFTQPCTIESDASIVGCGAVLTQNGHVVAFMSRKFTETQGVWTTSEQELYAIVCALQEWRCYVEGSSVTLLTDHHPLVWFQSQEQLSHKQAH